MAATDDPFAGLASPVDTQSAGADPFAGLASPVQDQGAATPPADSTNGEGLTDILAQSATFGLANPMRAGLRALNETGANLVSGDPNAPSFGDTYTKALGDLQGGQAAVSEAHPYLSPLTKALGMVGGAGPSLVRSAAGLGQRILEGIGIGGGMGAISGAGNSAAGADTVAHDAIYGGVGGGLIGGAIPAAAELISPLLRLGTSKLAPGRAAEMEIADRLGQDQAGSKSTDYLGDLPTLLDQADATGKPLALIDLGGENTRKLGYNVMAKPGEARENATDFLLNRQIGEPGAGQDRFSMDRTGGSGQRLIGDLDQTFGSQNARTLTDDIIAKRDAAAKPLYEAFRAEPPVPTDHLAPFADSPTFGQAVKRANAAVLDEGGQPLTNYFTFDADGNLKIVPNGAVPPDTLDRIKQGLDDVVGAAKAKGDRGEMRTAMMLKSRFLTFLDNRYASTYPAARAAYSGPTASANALTDGAQAMRTENPEELRSIIQDLDPADFPLFQLGARQGLADLINKRTEGGNAAQTVFGTPWKRNLLKEVFNSPQQYDDFMQRVGMENRMSQTKNALMGNSQTGERLAETGSDSGKGLEMAAGAMASGEPLTGLAMSGINWLKGASQTMSPAVRAEVAKRLFTSDPVQNRATVNALTRMIRGDPSQGIAPIASRQSASLLATPAASGYLASHPVQLWPWGSAGGSAALPQQQGAVSQGALPPMQQ